MNGEIYFTGLGCYIYWNGREWYNPSPTDSIAFMKFWGIDKSEKK